MKEARAYESPLRAEQMEQTRLRILHAVTEVLADPTAEEVTIPLVARRARVSLRTVYRTSRRERRSSTPGPSGWTRA